MTSTAQKFHRNHAIAKNAIICIHKRRSRQTVFGSKPDRRETNRRPSLPEYCRDQSGPVMTCWELTSTGVSSIAIKNNYL